MSGLNPAPEIALWTGVRFEQERRTRLALAWHDRMGHQGLGCTEHLGSPQPWTTFALDRFPYSIFSFLCSYTVTIEVSPGRSEELLRHFKEMYPSLLVHASSGTLLTFNVPVGRLELPELIEQLEERRQHGISDYSVSQASLEQVFLGMSQGA